MKKPTKTIQCIDCGEWFEVKNKANQSRRCLNCQNIERKRLARERKRKQRLRIKSA